MACGEQINVIQSYWTWCRKWGIPYPCRKRRTVIRYRYEFIPWRSILTWPFRCKYEGCCGSFLYRWSHWCWFGTVTSGWNQFGSLTQNFDAIQTPVGDCPFNSDVVD